MTMKRLLSAIGLIVLLAGSVHAQQLGPTPIQGSSAAEGSHVFSGTTFQGAVVTWQSATTARYFMVFDATSLPSNGSTTSCTASQFNGCLSMCIYMTESTLAPNRFAIDYTAHPIVTRNGVVEALSTGAGCGTLTVDGSNDFFYSQVR